MLNHVYNLDNLAIMAYESAGSCRNSYSEKFTSLVDVYLSDISLGENLKENVLEYAKCMGYLYSAAQQK